MNDDFDRQFSNIFKWVMGVWLLSALVMVAVVVFLAWLAYHVWG